MDGNRLNVLGVFGEKLVVPHSFVVRFAIEDHTGWPSRVHQPPCEVVFNCFWLLSQHTVLQELNVYKVVSDSKIAFLEFGWVGLFQLLNQKLIRLFVLLDLGGLINYHLEFHIFLGLVLLVVAVVLEGGPVVDVIPLHDTFLMASERDDVWLLCMVLHFGDVGGMSTEPLEGLVRDWAREPVDFKLG